MVLKCVSEVDDQQLHFTQTNILSDPCGSSASQSEDTREFQENIPAASKGGVPTSTNL